MNNDEFFKMRQESNIIIKSILSEFSRKKVKESQGMIALTHIISGYMAFYEEKEIEEFFIHLRALINDKKIRLPDLLDKDEK